MELLNTATTILVLQVLFLPIQIWSYIIRYQDRTRMRFFVLNIGYVLFNVLFSSQYENIGISQTNSQELCIYSGILLFGYLYYYIAIELDRFKAIDLIKLLLAFTALKFVWSQFETEHLTEKERFVWLIILAGVIVGVFIWTSFWLLIRRTLDNEIKSIPFVICIRIILLFKLSLPFTLFLVDNIEFQAITLNIPFFVLSFGYYWHYRELSQKENEVIGEKCPSTIIEQKWLLEINDIRTFGLKGALLEIAELLVEGYSQDEIAAERHVTSASVRNQCSKIYKKVSVKDLKAFRKKFNVNPRK